MLGGEPLTDDASIRDYNGGIGCHVASVLEETLLLPKDMVELQGLRRIEVFLQAKRFLGMVCIVTFSISFFFFTWHNSYFMLLARMLVIILIYIYIYIFVFVLLLSFFFFLNRLFKVHSEWRKYITLSHSSWMTKEKEGSLLCRH